MDLLPLALQAMDDRSARQVLADAFQALSREERYQLGLKVWKLRSHRGTRKVSRVNRRCYYKPHGRLPWGRSVWPRKFVLREWSRALATVMWFEKAQWSAKRWPVNDPTKWWEAPSDGNITGLAAWMPGTTTITSIDRAAGTLMYSGSPPTFLGVNREPERRLSAIVAPTEDDMRRLAIGEAPQVDGSFLREPSPEAVEDPGSLVALWDREMAVQRETVMRIAGWADPPDDEGQGDR